MEDADYPAQKMYDAVRLLVSRSMDAEVALAGALMEFEHAFGPHKEIPDWAREGVAKVRSVGRYPDIAPAADGTITSWVRHASEADRDACSIALLDLLVTASEMNARQLPSS